MPARSDSRPSPYRTDQLFELVADIESYPEFLPWCQGARILKREGDTVWADLIIAFKAFRGSYTSRVQCIAPKSEGEEAHIITELERGPFKHLHSRWDFTPTPSGGCDIAFSVDVMFRSSMLEMLIGGMFDKAMQKMTSAFEERAIVLYSTEK